jgi:hypothetical protein
MQLKYALCSAIVVVGALYSGNSSHHGIHDPAGQCSGLCPTRPSEEDLVLMQRQASYLAVDKTVDANASLQERVDYLEQLAGDSADEQHLASKHIENRSDLLKLTNNAQEVTLLVQYSGWYFYKVSTTSTSDDGILAACAQAGLVTSCVGPQSCPYTNSNFCTITIENGCGSPMLLTAQNMGCTGPSSCSPLNEVFAYMGGSWSSGGGCGTVNGGWCTVGTSSKQGYAFCASTNTYMPPTPSPTTAAPTTAAPTTAAPTTAAPTTAAPTTTSPTLPQVSASGDPHLINLRGERFGVNPSVQAQREHIQKVGGGL